MDRVEQALTLFSEGYNCCQAVFGAYCDLFGVPQETGLRLAAGMGGGMGGIREKCGAATAMFLLAGLKYGGYPPADHEAKKALYALVREMDEAFTKKFGGSQCGSLLRAAKAVFAEIPAKRDAHYYESRPCSKFVEGACELIEERLLGQS